MAANPNTMAHSQAQEKHVDKSAQSAFPLVSVDSQTAPMMCLLQCCWNEKVSTSSVHILFFLHFHRFVKVSRARGHSSQRQLKVN